MEQDTLGSSSTGTQDNSTQTAASDMSDAPPSLYGEVNNGTPFAIKMLGLELYDGDDDFQDMRDQAKALDNYITQQMRHRGLNDDAAGYKEVVNAIYKQIGYSKNEDPTKSLKRLSTAADALKRLERARLPGVLSASNLTPTEYEDIQP